MRFSVPINVKSVSPICVTSERTTASQVGTLDYIPGTALRGALAGDFIQRYQIETALKDGTNVTGKQKELVELFRRFFVSDEVSFGNLYPKNSLSTQPFPLTARSCKFHSGFGTIGQHGVCDILIPSLLFRLTGSFPIEFEKCSYDVAGTPCEAPLELISGYYSANLRTDLQQRIYAPEKAQSQVSRRNLAHTAIHAVTETNLSGALYAMDVLSEEQDFEGEVWFADKDICDQFVGLHPTAIYQLPEYCYVGADRTRGLGRGELTKGSHKEHKVEKVKQDISQRWQFFNQEIHHRSEATGAGDPTLYFCVSLLSDAIVLDDYLRHQSFIRPEDLAESACTAGAVKVMEQYELFLFFTATRLISGWNVAPEARLPKEDDLAIAKGAVFVYRPKDGILVSDVNSDAMLDLFTTIMLNGIGLRRNEGFGRVSVCDYFHCLREAI